VQTTTTIGFIGLGLMGRPMALNLRKRGFSLVVNSRSRPPVDALVAAGAEAADSAAEVAARSNVVITMLPDTPDVVRVLTDDRGVFSSLRPGAVVIDMSTISPVVTKHLAEQAKALGAQMLDAPVSGGEIGAIDGSLSIMVGGEADVVARMRPVLEAMGHLERIVHVGPSGAGQIVKMCNQIVLAATLGGVSEAFALARKAGVDPAAMRKALLGGFANSRVLEVHGQRMLDRNYVPGFRASLFSKDLRIAAETLSAYGVDAQVSDAAREIVDTVVASSRGAQDYSSMAQVVFERAGIKE
jgi:2-hydroxy-3-oxopropionate reductase